MPRQKFNSSSSESSASLPKANFIASDNKKPGTSLKRKQPSSSSSDESDSENEQHNIKGKPQQNRLKQMKIELKTPVKQSKSISHKEQERPNKNVKLNEEPNKKKQMENSKMMRVENHAEIEDQHERASSSNSVNAQNEAWPKPKEMYNFFKAIIDLGNDNKIHLAGKKANANLESLLKGQPDLDPAIDLAEMHNLFGKVYQQATKPSETPLVYALNHVLEYVQSESILKQYSDRPKPHKMWNIFLANNGKTPFNAGEELRQKFKNKEDIDVKRAKEEYNKCTETYIAQMREYLNQNKDNLFDAQIDYIQKKIKKLEKSFGNQKENGKEKAKRSKRTKNKEKVEKATPFELWKMTKEKEDKLFPQKNKFKPISRYPDLPEEQRNAKLLKMFNKLNEAEKSVFEKLAEALNKKQSNE